MISFKRHNKLFIFDISKYFFFVGQYILKSYKSMINMNLTFPERQRTEDPGRERLHYPYNSLQPRHSSYTGGKRMY